MSKFMDKVNNGDFDLLINGSAVIGLLVVSMTITNKIWERAEKKLREREDLGYQTGYKDCAEGWREFMTNHDVSKKDKA